MISLANTCPKPNTMMIKLKYASITIMAMLRPRRLLYMTIGARKISKWCSRGVHVHHHLCPRCYICLNSFFGRVPVYGNHHIYIFAWSRLFWCLSKSNIFLISSPHCIKDIARRWTWCYKVLNEGSNEKHEIWSCVPRFNFSFFNQMPVECKEKSSINKVQHHQSYF